MSDNENNNNENKNDEELEVVIGDNSVLNFVEVGDVMNDLRPKDKSKQKKNIIIPTEKKNVVPKAVNAEENKPEENKEEPENNDSSDDENK